MENNVGGQLLKNFIVLRPPEFYGGIDVLATENWMLSVEKYLRTIRYSDTQMVQFTTFLLRGDLKDGGKLPVRGSLVGNPHG